MHAQRTTPICVDIDGTLTRTNTLLETCLVAIKKRPLRMFPILWALTKGKSHVKDLLGKYGKDEPITFPYHAELLSWLKEQRKRGRKLILASATDEAIAQKISEEIGIFDEVIASRIDRPVSARKKHLVLKERFQGAPFAYAGNSASDLSVWKVADSAIIVQAASPVSAAAKKVSSAEMEFPLETRPTLAVILREIRVHQWLKNLLLYVPAIAAHTIGQPEIFLAATAGFFSFSFLASAMYVFNDLLDLPSDRLHPVKKDRPLASGALSLSQGILLCIALGGLSILLAIALLPASFVWLLALYTAMNFLYTFRAKKVPYADIVMLASFYVLRIVAGGAATAIETSSWLLVFAACFFLNLASMKRTAELLRLQEDKETIRGRGYSKQDVKTLNLLGAACIALSCIVLALYITNPGVTTLYMHPILLWGELPLIVLWTARMWRLTLSKRMPDDPVLFAGQDIKSYLIAASMLAILFIAA